MGVPSLGITVGSAADLISLNIDHDALGNRGGDAVIDAWIFAARLPAVDCVWRFGRKVVTEGRHNNRDQIVARYRTSLKTLAAI